MNKKQREQVNRFWNRWVEETNRPKEQLDNPQGGFPDAVLEALDMYEAEALEELMEFAARMPPRANDRYDVKRAISVMESEGQYEKAYERWENDRPVREYEPKPPPQLGTYAVLAEVLKLPEEHWEADEEEAAFALTTKYSDRELRDLKEHAALEGKMERNMSPISFRNLVKHNGRAWLEGKGRRKRKKEEAPTPEEVLGLEKPKESKPESSPEPPKAAASYVGAKPLRRSGYILGSYESGQLHDVRLPLDVKANEMFKSGFSTEVIRAFHFDVPEGYWDAVEEECENNPDLLPEETYSVLASQFDGWTPEERRV